MAFDQTPIGNLTAALMEDWKSATAKTRKLET